MPLGAVHDCAYCAPAQARDCCPAQGRVGEGGRAFARVAGARPLVRVQGRNALCRYPKAARLGQVHGAQPLDGRDCKRGVGKPPFAKMPEGACAELHAHILRTVSTVMLLTLRWVP